MTAPAPALEYARPVTPEGFLVRRTPSVVVVSAVPTARRILRATRGFTVTVLVVAAWVAPAVYFQPTGGLPPLWALIIPGLFLLLAAWLLFEQLVWVLDPVRWELDATRLLMVSRRLTGVVREELPRAALGDLRVEKLRLKDRVFKSLHLVASTPGGFQVAIASGTRRELEALRGLLAEALGIPTDPGGEAAYPPRPPGARADRRVTPAGVWMTLGPPAVSWPVVLTAGAVLLAAALAVEHFATFRSPTRDWTPAEARAWAVARVSMITLIPLTVLSVALYRLRRRTSLGLQGGTLLLVETGLVRPSHEEWPPGAVAGVETAPAGRASRASLHVLLRDGRTVTALEGERRRDVEWTAACLRHALARAAEEQGCEPR